MSAFVTHVIICESNGVLRFESMGLSYLRKFAARCLVPITKASQANREIAWRVATRMFNVHAFKLEV